MYYECIQSLEKDPFTLDKFARRDFAAKESSRATVKEDITNFTHNSHIRERYLHTFKSHIR